MGALKALGLDEMTERVYRLLLNRRDLDIDMIAAELFVTTDQVRSSFDRLAELALLRPSWESSDKLHPVSPEAGLRSLVQRRQAEVLRQQQQIAEAQAAISGLVSDCAELCPGVPQPKVECLVGMDAVQSRIEELAMNARLELASFMPRGAHSPRTLEAAKSLDLQVRGRGVDIHTICLDSIRNDAPTLSYAQWLVEIGAEVRTVPTLPVRMLIYDRKIAILPLDPSNTRKGIIQVADGGMVTAVFALFEQIWAVATPIGATPVRDDVGLSAQERELLKLLAEGLTDEGAGRQLGLSQRTVRRMMADMMRRLGARSRFEAGHRAAERGWL